MEQEETMKHIRWGWEYAVFLAGMVLTGGLLITLFASCATTYVPVIRIPVGSDALGWTVCDDDGHAAILYLDSVPPTYFRYLMLHEYVHISQIRREGDCKRFIAKYAGSEKVRMESEAEAECVVVAVATMDGYPVDLKALWDYFKQKYPNTSEEDRQSALSCASP